MNTIHGIIHDLANEETIIGGCTTQSEVIIALQDLVEENNLLKCKLDKVKQARKKMESRIYKGAETTGVVWQNLGVNMCLEILDELIESEE